MYRVFQAVVVVIAALFFLLPDAHAVVGNVDGIITDGQGNAVPGCTIRITDTETGEVVDEHTTDKKGGIFLWVPKDGTYRTEVIRDGQAVITSDIDLRGGSKRLAIDVDNKTITLSNIPFLGGIRVGIDAGWGWNNGSHLSTGPLFGFNFSAPLFSIGNVANVRVEGRGNVSFNTLDNDTFTERTAPTNRIGSFDFEFPVSRLDSTGQIYNGSVGVSIERPTSNGILGDAIYYGSAGIGVTHYANTISWSCSFCECVVIQRVKGYITSTFNTNICYIPNRK